MENLLFIGVRILKHITVVNNLEYCSALFLPILPQITLFYSLVAISAHYRRLFSSIHCLVLKAGAANLLFQPFLTSVLIPHQLYQSICTFRSSSEYFHHYRNLHRNSYLIANILNPNQTLHFAAFALVAYVQIMGIQSKKSYDKPTAMNSDHHG